MRSQRLMTPSRRHNKAPAGGEIDSPSPSGLSPGEVISKKIKTLEEMGS
jgi:hypothetical protein